MDIKDIIVIKQFKPSGRNLQIEKNPAKQTIALLHKLIDDDYFQQQVIKLRQKHTIPSEGYTLKRLEEAHGDEVVIAEHEYQGKIYKEYARKELSPDHPLYPDFLTLYYLMEEDLIELNKYYNLMYPLLTHVFFLIAYNMIPDDLGWGIDRNNLVFTFGKDNIKERLNMIKHDCAAIIIPHRVTKQELKNWISNNDQVRDYIWKKIAELPPQIGKVKYENLELGAEIYRLHKKGKTVKQITNALYDKYPDDDRITEQFVNLNLKRYITFLTNR
jgi:hypothetical protein